MVRYFSAGTFLHFFQQSFSTGSFQWLQDPKDRFSDISGMKKDSQPNRVEASIICRPLPPTGPCPPKGGKIHCTDRVIKNRRINQCGDTAVSGIMFSVMDSTEVPLGGGGRGGCFLRKRPPFSFPQLSVFGIFCYRSIALMVLPVDLFHFGELCGGSIRRFGFFRQVCLRVYSTPGTLLTDASAASVFPGIYVYMPAALLHFGEPGDGCGDLVDG